jgi:hypothetical protein
MSARGGFSLHFVYQVVYRRLTALLDADADAPRPDARRSRGAVRGTRGGARKTCTARRRVSGADGAAG